MRVQVGRNSQQDTNWIKNAAQYFEDDKVGIVGGTVYQMGGDVLFRYGWFDCWGHNIAVTDDPIVYDDPKGERYSCGQGCNVFFRKKALTEVGGFDEYYAFYLDESDLGMRIIQHGYTCRYGKDMAVIHEAAPGPNRKAEYHEDLFVIGRSQGYFILKATETTGRTKEEREKIARESVRFRIENLKWGLDHQRIKEDEYKAFVNEMKRDIEQGIRDSENKRKLDYSIGASKAKFKKYDKSITAGLRNICVYCGTKKEEIPKETGLLIRELTDQGHNVYVIVRGERTKLDLIDGVNYCTFAAEPQQWKNGEGLPYAAFSIIQELRKTFGVRMMVTPVSELSAVLTCSFSVDQLCVTGDAIKTEEEISLRKTGIQYGPYITLEKGVYEVEYSGNDLHLIDDYSTTTDFGKQQIPNMLVRKEKHKVQYTFSIDKQTTNIEFVAANHNEQSVEITGIKLRQIG